MYIKKTKLLFMALFLSPIVVIMFSGEALAAPGRCIVYDTGSDILSSEDDTYTTVDCETSAYAGLQNFEDDRFYKINITPVAEPQVAEMSEEDFNSQSSIINGGGDVTAGSNFEAKCKDDNGNGSLDKEECGIVGYIITATNILSAAVGVIIVIMIAVGGIQYTTARDDPQAVAAAKQRIQNAILALVFYLFAFSFLQWLIPGGLF